LRRQKELFEAHAGSQRDYESAEDNYGKAKAEMDRARQKARLFRGGGTDAVTQEFVLRAPIEGQVIARSVNPGAEVQGQYSGGAAVELFTVGELDSVWVFADVFEMDLARVRKDAPVSIKVVAYPDRAFAGKVDWISDALDPTSRTARVRCSLPNPGRELKPEMYATVAISVPAPTVAALPRAALLRIGDQTVVFVQNGNAPDGRVKFARRIVAVNEDEGADYVPIVRGVNRGDAVVTSGAILLSGML
jgi:cobalt-zinc-cadmium efflux system membrane fusion protein